MSVRVAINGFGRICRHILRAIVENNRKDIEVVGINDLAPVATNAHLLRFDSVHGRFPGEVMVASDSISVGNDKIKVTAVKGVRRRHRARMYRYLHVEGEGICAPRRRCQPGHHLGPG